MALPSFIIRRLAAAASPASRPRSGAREKRVLAFGWSWADYRIWQTGKRSGELAGTGISSTGPWPGNPSFACRPGQTNGNLMWQDLAAAAPLGLAYASHAGLIFSRAGAVMRAWLETSGTRPRQVLTKVNTRLTNNRDTGLQLVRTDGVVPTWIIAELGS